MLKAHPELQAILIDVQQYEPTWLIGGASAILQELDFLSNAVGKWEDEMDKLVDLDAMYCTKIIFGKVYLLFKAHFVLGKAVYMQFDSSSQEGHAMGSFVILDIDGEEIVQPG